MSDTASRHDHGNTPAAWTAVVIILIGFVAGALGVVAGSSTVVLAGAGVIVFGAVVGKVMQMMGLGKQPADV